MRIFAKVTWLAISLIACANTNPLGCSELKAEDKNGAALREIQTQPSSSTRTSETRPSSIGPTITFSANGTNGQEIHFAASGRWFATTGFDSTVRLWETETGRLIRILQTKAAVWSVSISSDEKSLVSMDRNGEIIFWDVENGSVVKTLKEDDLGYAVLSKDGASLYVLIRGASTLKKIDLVTLQSRTLFQWSDAKNLISNFSVSPDETRIVLTSGGDYSRKSRIAIIDGQSGAVLRTLQDNKSDFGNVTISPNGKLVAWTPHDSTSSNKTVTILNLNDGTLIRKIEVPIRDVAFSFDAENNLLMILRQGELSAWNPLTGKLLHRFAPYGSDVGIVSVAASFDGKYVASALYTGGFVIWDAKTSSVRHLQDSRVDRWLKVITFDNDQWAIVGTSGSSIWDASNGKLVEASLVGDQPFNQMEASKDEQGHFIVANNSDSNVLERRTMFARPTGIKYQWEKKPLTTYLPQIQVSKNGKVIAGTTGDDGEPISVWDAKSGNRVRSFRVASADFPVAKLALSSDGRWLAASGFLYRLQKDASFAVWDLNSAGTGRVASTHTRPTFIEFSPDGNQILTLDNDEGLLWDRNTLERSQQIVSQTRSAQKSSADPHWFESSPAATPLAMPFPESARFSPDGHQIALWGTGTSLGIVDSKTGLLTKVLDNRIGSPSDVAFSTKGDRLFTASENGTGTIWDPLTGTLLAMSVRSQSGEWVTITPEGFFVASNNGANLLHVVRGFETISIKNFYQTLYRPDLVREKLLGDPRGLVRQAAANLDLNKIVASGSPPDVKVTLPARASGSIINQIEAEAEISDRGGGVGRVEWRVNGVTAGIDNPQSAAGQLLRLTRTLTVDAGDNTIEVVAYNSANLIASEPGHVSVAAAVGSPPQPTPTGAPAPAVAGAATPRLFVLAAGSDDYADKRFRLQYSVPDAKAMAQAFTDAGKGLYASVEVKVMSNEQVVTDKLEAAFSELSKKILPSDVFVLYLAGHGKTVEGRYFFVPQNFKVDGEATEAKVDFAVKAQGISQEQWQRWFAAIAARKSMILFDTCESGTLTGDVGETKALERGGANDRLAQATGRSIITASSGSTEAFEGYHGHGLFTYNLLDALDRGDGDNNGTIEVTELATFVYSQVIAISEKVFKQRQEPQMKITLNYPLAKQAHVLKDNVAPVADVRPTNQISQAAQLQIKPGSGATVVRSLSAKTAVTVLNSEGGWSLVASKGRPIGYVATRDLTPMR